MERRAGVLAMAEAVATIDPELAELRCRGHSAMRQRFRRIAATLNAQGRAHQARLRSNALATDPVYPRLTDEYGWSAEDYTHWLATVLIATLTDSDNRGHGRR
jgi:hypothetical protein